MISSCIFRRVTSNTPVESLRRSAHFVRGSRQRRDFHETFHNPSPAKARKHSRTMGENRRVDRKITTVPCNRRDLREHSHRDRPSSFTFFRVNFRANASREPVDSVGEIRRENLLTCTRAHAKAERFLARGDRARVHCRVPRRNSAGL